MKTRAMSLSAVMAAMLCLIGPVTLPVGPVPVALTGFGVCLAGGVLGPAGGAWAVLIYILLGMAGLPVFSGFSGGMAALMGPTGGYIVGYLPCAVICGLSIGGREKHIPRMILGTAVMYALGTARFIGLTGNAPGAAIAMCVLPFIPGDALKIVFAAKAAKAVNRALGARGGSAG